MELVYNRHEDLQTYVTRRLENSPKLFFPFPHIFCENVFPAQFYNKILNHLAKKSDYHEEGFANRTFGDNVDIPGIDFMHSDEFLNSMFFLFRDQAFANYANKETVFEHDLRLVRDSKNYKIGPHTDKPIKVLSLLFYLPRTSVYRDCGTSLYVPRDPNYRDDSGAHHPFELFKKVWTAPFLPNSCFGFWKTNNSFHGVEPLPFSFRRDVLLYNIYDRSQGE